MIHEYVAAQGGGIEMDIDLGGGDGFVTEHLLYGSQIGATFKEMRGK